VFYGHTHHPRLFGYHPEFGYKSINFSNSLSVPIEKGWKVMINPGSVGVPRDEDPRASYLVFDEDADRVELRRVSYLGMEAGRDINCPCLLDNVVPV
jgi:diadenosine tetraphosphatase ApaH/serine/threonine PP2A family protein phosphatase